MSKPRMPRGVRNHNPLNLREAKDGGAVWMGERATDDDPQFEEFEFPEAGIRAGARTLLTYQRQHGLTTVNAMLQRFAPPRGADSDGKAYTQDTAAYARVVCTALGVDGDQDIDVSDFAVAFPMVKAMIRHEQGPAPSGWEGRTDGTWYADAVIRRGLELAGIKHTVPPASQSPTARAATAGGVLGTGLAVNEAVTLVDKAGGLAAMDTAALVRLVVVVAVVAVCWYIVARRARKSGQEG